MNAPFTKSTGHPARGSAYSPEKRSEMVAVAAYYRAEHRSFSGGDMISDWVQAEAEIDRMLGLKPRKAQGLKSKAAFQRWLESDLKELDEKLGTFKMKALEVKGKLHAGLEKQLKTASEETATARERLQELQLRTEDAWEDMKEGTEKILSELRQTIDRIASRFK